jgi:uncharacterized Zn-binding protein involved in type VI secretion
MANAQILGLVEETAPAAGDALPIQRTAGVRAKYVSIESLGFLETTNETITTGDATVAVGQMHYLTIAGMTADRNFVLPAATIGDRIGVYIVDGDATNELIIKGDTGVSINGGTAATEWSRLFIANECVKLHYHAANDWRVEYDGRIKSFAHMYEGTVTSMIDSAWTKITVDSLDAADNIGDIGDTTNTRINIRRDGQYFVVAAASVATTGVAGDTARLRIDDAASAGTTLFRGPSFEGEVGGSQHASLATTLNASAGDELHLFMFQNHGSNKDTVAVKATTNLVVKEL